MIRLCGHKGDIERAEALLQLMQVDGYEANIDTYNMVVNACTQKGDVERAEWHVEQMQRHGMQPDMVTFNSLLNGLAATGNLRGVEDCFQKMTSLGVSPNCVTFGTICKAFARVGDVEKVETIMQSLDEAGQPLNEYFFASLIAACGTCQPPRSVRAEKAFRELVSRGLRPQSVKSALVRAVGKRRANFLMSSYGERTQGRVAGDLPERMAPPPGLVSLRGSGSKHGKLPQTGPVQRHTMVGSGGALERHAVQGGGEALMPERRCAHTHGFKEVQLMASRMADFARFPDSEAFGGKTTTSYSHGLDAKELPMPSFASAIPQAWTNAAEDGAAYVPGATLRTVLQAGHAVSESHR